MNDLNYLTYCVETLHLRRQKLFRRRQNSICPVQRKMSKTKFFVLFEGCDSASTQPSLDLFYRPFMEIYHRNVSHT